MAKYVCQVCGYVYEGDAAPAECPICHAPASKFTKQEEGKTWAAEHVVGVAKGAPEDIIADLRANFQGECSEVGYLFQHKQSSFPIIRRLVQERLLSVYQYCRHIEQIKRSVRELPDRS